MTQAWTPAGGLHYSRPLRSTTTIDHYDRSLPPDYRTRDAGDSGQALYCLPRRDEVIEHTMGQGSGAGVFHLLFCYRSSRQTKCRPIKFPQTEATSPQRRHWRAALLTLLLGGSWFSALPTWAGDEISIAVAANLQNTFAELASAFKTESGIIAQASFGSTGKLSTQIRQGAPFHLLLAADSDYPKALQADGFALQAPRPYAIGSLVIWTTRELALDNWRELLLSDQVRHIAIANPETAPYGREAARALRHFALLRGVQQKLVYGESIGQTNQFIISGAAEIGFTAKASVLELGEQRPGQWREVPPESYAPIIQSAVLLRYAETHQRAAAERFYAFLLSPAARAIFQRHGYQTP